MTQRITKEQIEKVNEELIKLYELEEERRKTDPTFLHYDFQGWPVTKKTLRELLNSLGAQTFEIEGKNVFGFLTEEPILDIYPKTLEDDGMAYGINEMLFTDANIIEDKEGNKQIHFWRDKVYENK